MYPGSFPHSTFLCQLRFTLVASYRFPIMTFRQEADLMARVLEDDIVFRFRQNFSVISVSDFHLSGNGFSLFYLSSLTQILICSLEW